MSDECPDDPYFERTVALIFSVVMIAMMFFGAGVNYLWDAVLLYTMLLPLPLTALLLATGRRLAFRAPTPMRVIAWTGMIVVIAEGLFTNGSGLVTWLTSHVATWWVPYLAVLLGIYLTCRAYGQDLHCACPVHQTMLREHGDLYL